MLTSRCVHRPTVTYHQAVTITALGQREKRVLHLNHCLEKILLKLNSCVKKKRKIKRGPITIHSTISK